MSTGKDTLSAVVGRELRRVRDALGWTRTETVARMPSGIGDRTLLSYEHGIRELTMSRFVEICRVYGVSPGSVLSAAFRLDPNDVEQATIIVDLPVLVQDTTPGYKAVRDYAQRKLLADGVVDFAEFSPIVVRELALYAGFSHFDLATYLAGFIIGNAISGTVDFDEFMDEQGRDDRR